MSSEQSTFDDYAGGNPDPTPGNNPAEYAERRCPFCGATVKKLPTHLRRHCEETA